MADLEGEFCYLRLALLFVAVALPALGAGVEGRKGFASLSGLDCCFVGDYVGAMKTPEAHMEETINIDNRGDFGLWAIEMAKQIVSDQGFELARAARDGNEDRVRTAGNALGQAITQALMEVYDGLLDGASD